MNRISRLNSTGWQIDNLQELPCTFIEQGSRRAIHNEARIGKEYHGSQKRLQSQGSVRPASDGEFKSRRRPPEVFGPGGRTEYRSELKRGDNGARARRHPYRATHLSPNESGGRAARTSSPRPAPRPHPAVPAQYGRPVLPQLEAREQQDQMAGRRHEGAVRRSWGRAARQLHTATKRRVTDRRPRRGAGAALGARPAPCEREGASAPATPDDERRRGGAPREEAPAAGARRGENAR